MSKAVSLLVGGLLLAVAPVMHTEAAPPARDITISFSDFGIGQRWDATVPPVSDITLAGPTAYPKADLFDRKPDDGIGRILIRMPSDAELTNTNGRLRDLYARDLERQLRALIDQGYTKFDVQFVENISVMGYSIEHFTHRQELVNRFGQIGYGALADVVNRLSSAGNNVSLFGTLGSNGTAMFARARDAWSSIERSILQVTMVDGRATFDDLDRTLKVLEPSKLRLIVNLGDIYSWAHSTIATQSVVQKLIDRYKNVQALVLTQMASAMNEHISSMTHPNARFRVDQLSADGRTVTIGQYATREQIHPYLTGRDVRANAGNLAGTWPAIWRVPDPAQLPSAQPGRGGVELDITLRQGRIVTDDIAGQVRERK